jgi:hypothetical protein
MPVPALAAAFGMLPAPSTALIIGLEIFDILFHVQRLVLLCLCIFIPKILIKKKKKEKKKEKRKISLFIL